MNRYIILIIFNVFFYQINAQEPNDCVNAITVCGNGTFISNATGSGNDFEINACGGFEHNSLWLEVNIVQSGTLGFDLIPIDPDIMVDYDFWVFGPNRLCSNLGSPIRCATTNPNAAGLPNNYTGINGSTTLTQSGPGANGNGYVYWLDVNVGESYFIVIDRPEGDGGFEIQWTGTATEGSGAFPAPPTVNEIDDVLQCSSNSDIAVFGLDGLKSSINSDPLNTIDFYESLADATDDINELPGIYANTSNPQTIYAKVKSSGTDCYSIIDFDLIVTPIPDASVDVSSTAICESEAVTFTITGTPNATILYNLDGGTTESILLGASGLATLTQSPASDMTINLEDAQILNDSGIVVCAQSLSDSETVTVSSNTTPIIVNNAPICEGEDGELVISGDLNATITYAINNGALQTLTLDTTGNFTLVLPTLTTTTNVEIISVTSGVIPNCVQTLNTIETLTVNPLPTVIAPSPLLVCNDGINPNSASFDLDAESAAISNFETNVSVTYYETQALAEAGNPLTALLSPYDSTSANQTVYVRVETDLGCVDYTTLSLEVVGAPIANTVPALQSCDVNSQGFGTFDLTIAEAAIIAGNTQPVQVSYYLSEAEAEAGTPEITDPTFFQNTDAYNQTIYVRVDTDGTDCYNISDLSLEVFDTPTVNTLQPFEVCDDVVNDGFTQFDLESQTPLLLGGATDVTVTYYESEADAEDGIDAITGLYTNTSSTQTIFIRAENNFNVDCFEITTLTLIVNPLPTTITPTPLQVCDDGAPDGLTEIDLSLKTSEITGGNPNYVVNYYLNLSDAESENNPLPILYTNTSNGQIIVARVDNIITGCYNFTTLELVVEQAPVANSPTPLDYCDPDSDGFGVFDLTLKDDEITGGDATLTVSYHETMADADNNVNPITSPYSNIVINAQTVYARVESSTIATDCDSIVTLLLSVNPTPQLGATAPEPLAICDDSSADGFGQFDLTSKISEILENLADPTLYNVTFYLNETDADNGLNEITNTTNYTNSDDFSQVIWVRVEDNVSGCYKLTTLELIVNAIPVLVQAAPLVVCDDNNPGDEIETFILEDAADEILNGQSGIGLTFFETQDDADNNINPIFSPYSNIANPQTIFVKATNNETGCSNTITLTLRVNPIPSPAAPADLEVCDDDTDGFTNFDLEERTIEIIGGELDVDITYHETLEDANTGSNAFSSPYTNIVMNQQTIYIRATNTITGCYDISRTLTLRVLETPQVPVTLTEYVICDSDADGYAQFDLTTKDSEIIGGQTDVSLTYHVNEADALSGNNPISTPGSFTNSGNPQTIWVRLENDNNICFDTGYFEISVALPPEAIQPTPLEVCDDDVADEITVFDLTVKNDEITGGQAGWSVAYYETLAAAENGIDAVDDEAYTNVSVLGAMANPQTLFAVVTDTNSGCTDIVTLTIRVMPNPTPTPSDQLPNLEVCDDLNTGDGVEVIDLTENEILILNGESGVTASYYESFIDANSGNNAIPDPTQYINTETPEQEIFVRVTNDVTGCYTIVDFTVVVHPLPEVVAVTDFIQCELFTDGFDNFDLTTKDEEVLNGQDPTQFIVSYHDKLADAEAGMNGLVSLYTNSSNPQQIFVTITNNVTGCSISTQSFYIEVQEAAQANPNMDPILYETCDDEMETDGDASNDSAQFDLTTVDAEVLDGQNPLNYIVTYFATQEEADLNVNPLPTLYENITNPQIIYARVDNDTPDGTGADTSICYEVAPLTLQVNPLPEFDLGDSYTLCLNTNGTEVLDPLVIDTGLSATDYSFEWSYEGTIIAGATGPSIMPSQGGSYSVLVTDMSTSTETNCTNMDITTVIESAPPSLSVELLTQAFADNHVLEAVATGIGVYEYSLDGGPWQDEGVFTNVSTGEHEITARDKNGCGITTESIFVIDYPLYFTPNGDGTNDTWNIEGIGSNAIIYIFDRYGKLLKQISPEGDGWNGTYNSKAMPTSDYWFTVEYDEPSTGQRKEFKAHFALKR
ncbi:T9SS type B sorting domain-containing protein [Winogradskyella sediminis]|uniref:T9SS type B sorting domain-containing protein n=1 Tax=Winogradskyella sediminis TaxID=1382466 RepID=UPI000E26062D|nr:T9SS type B sorting domain-containing protein [Winogradskyella sediminis]REG87526.1 gliding motility-associated-like protein [Winogradskyella sediminis]